MALTDRIPTRLQPVLRRLRPFQRAFELWSEAGGMRMSAAMSFYGVLSLAPLLVVIVAALAWWVDRSVLEKGLLDQLGSIIGAQGTAVIAEALKNNAGKSSDGIAASAMAFVVLLFGATGVFGELQNAFERVWSQGRGPQPRQSWMHTASLRLRGIGYILVFGFLLLVSLVVSTLLSMFSGWAGGLAATELALRVVNEVIGFGIGTLLFVGLMRLSGGPKPRLRFLLFGAAVGALLFTIGRQMLALYLANAAVISAYGAAGSLIVLLMWIYFSSAVLLLGAATSRAIEDYVTGNRDPLQRGSSERRWASASASAETTPSTSSTPSPQR